MVPKVLVLTQAVCEYEGGEAPCGVLALEDTDFFEVLREHQEAVLAFHRSVSGAIRPCLAPCEGVTFRYREFTSDHGTGCFYLVDRLLAVVDDDLGLGHPDLLVDELLNLYAEDILRPNVSPVATLEGGERPVVIDFALWHESINASGVNVGTPEQFWEMLSSGTRTSMERLVLTMPGYASKEQKLENLLTFHFTAAHKHSNSMVDFTSEALPVRDFLQAVGDAVASRMK